MKLKIYRKIIWCVDELEYQKTRLVKSDDIMTLKLRYKMPNASKSKLLKYKIKKEDIDRKPSENFNWSMAVAEFGLLLRDSKFKANSSYKHVISLAKENKGKDADGNRAEFIKLVETAELISSD